MMNEIVHLLKCMNSTEVVLCVSHVHRMKTLRDVAFLTPSEHRIIETVLSLDGRNHL
jgi:hypothetical protein